MIRMANYEQKYCCLSMTVSLPDTLRSSSFRSIKQFCIRNNES